MQLLQGSQGRRCRSTVVFGQCVNSSSAKNKGSRDIGVRSGLRDTPPYYRARKFSSARANSCRRAAVVKWYSLSHEVGRYGWYDFVVNPFGLFIKSMRFPSFEDVRTYVSSNESLVDGSLRGSADRILDATMRGVYRGGRWVARSRPLILLEEGVG